jgi:hypothetical protein
VDVRGSPEACGWPEACVSPWPASPLPPTPLSSYLSASHMRYISEAVANVQRAVNTSLAVNTLLSTPAPQVLSLLAWYQEEEYGVLQ